MMKNALLWLVISLCFYTTCSAQKDPIGEVKPTRVGVSGQTEVGVRFGGKPGRIVISADKIDLGGSNPTPPPAGQAKTNCTYSRFPCSQVTNIEIWVAGKKLFVPRSVFADCADVGSMIVTSEAGTNVVTLYGGDASEAYMLKVFFDSSRVKKRELYDLESKSLLQATTYFPPPKLD